MTKVELSTLANEAMDAFELCREKLMAISTICEGNKSGASVEILGQIGNAATPLVKAYSAIEDIYNAIEDMKDED